MMKKLTLLVTACVLAACVTGCGCQAEKPTETTAASVQETVREEKTRQKREPGTAASEPSEPAAADPTKATGPTKPAGPTKPTDSTKATEAPGQEDLWGQAPTGETLPPVEVTVPQETRPYTSYEAYMDMSGKEQEAFFDSFEKEDDFFAWFKEAKAEYDRAHPPVIIDGNTNIELKP